MRLASEADCEQFVFQVRFPLGFVCPHCAVARGWQLRHGRLIECANGHKVSLTAGTRLHGSRQPLSTWLYAAYLVSTLTPGISALQLQRQLGLSRYETAFQMLHKIRSVLVAPGRERLRGQVEVDETFIGGKDPDRDGRARQKLRPARRLAVLLKATQRLLLHRGTRLKMTNASDSTGRSGS